MAKSLAAKFEGVEIRHRSPGKEASSHGALLDLGWSFSPRVEDTAPDTIVLDLAGLASLFGSEENIAQSIDAAAPPISVSTPMWPSLATWKRPCLRRAVFPELRKFLRVKNEGVWAAYPVHFLPASQEILETLERWGIRNCEAFAALPLLDLSERIGQAGVRLHELARGAYPRSLILAEPGHSFEEEMTLEDAVEELEPLAFILGRLLDQLTARLDARSLAVNSIRVQFELDTASQMEVSEFAAAREAARQKRTAGKRAQQRTCQSLTKKFLRCRCPCAIPKCC